MKLLLLFGIVMVLTVEKTTAGKSNTCTKETIVNIANICSAMDCAGKTEINYRIDLERAVRNYCRKGAEEKKKGRLALYCCSQRSKVEVRLAPAPYVDDSVPFDYYKLDTTGDTIPPQLANSAMFQCAYRLRPTIPQICATVDCTTVPKEDTDHNADPIKALLMYCSCNRTRSIHGHCCRQAAELKQEKELAAMEKELAADETSENVDEPTADADELPPPTTETKATPEPESETPVPTEEETTTTTVAPRPQFRYCGKEALKEAEKNCYKCQGHDVHKRATVKITTMCCDKPCDLSEIEKICC